MTPTVACVLRTGQRVGWAKYSAPPALVIT